ncbi:unnamed protein product [Prorocentrum cordatum]|uniref:4a-hydroxytetrahydrobiopterin dehydratase n=1 Tax=Prorocentrum cordatum TaxID=2364126 RepID=A0ABN9SNW6_9DINO|nr:unnamed protein product [Polarella glacialis]
MSAGADVQCIVKAPRKPRKTNYRGRYQYKQVQQTFRKNIYGKNEGKKESKKVGQLAGLPPPLPPPQSQVTAPKEHIAPKVQLLSRRRARNVQNFQEQVISKVVLPAASEGCNTSAQNQGCVGGVDGQRDGRRHGPSYPAAGLKYYNIAEESPDLPSEEGLTSALQLELEHLAQDPEGLAVPDLHGGATNPSMGNSPSVEDEAVPTEPDYAELGELAQLKRTLEYMKAAHSIQARSWKPLEVRFRRAWWRADGVHRHAQWVFARGGELSFANCVEVLEIAVGINMNGQAASST